MSRIEKIPVYDLESLGMQSYMQKYSFSQSVYQEALPQKGFAPLL